MRGGFGAVLGGQGCGKGLTALPSIGIRQETPQAVGGTSSRPTPTRQHFGHAEAVQPFGVVRLIAKVRDDELGDAGHQRLGAGPDATLMHDRRGMWEECRIRRVIRHVDVVRG